QAGSQIAGRRQLQHPARDPEIGSQEMKGTQEMKSTMRIALLLLPLTLTAAAPSEVADAVERGNREALRALLARKASVNAPQVDGTTALHWAVRSDDLETTDLLLKNGANASAANREGVMPLLLAAQNGNPAMMDRLIKGGANVNAALTKYGDTALMMASRTGN